MNTAMIAAAGLFCAAALFAQAFNTTCYASNGGSVQAPLKAEQNAN